MDIKGKKALVTGGAKGIGLELARTLAVQGCKVGIVDIDSEAIGAVRETDPDITFMLCDVSDPDQTRKAADDFCSEQGGVDILVNNAAMIYSSPIVSLVPGQVKMHGLEEWDRVISTNLNGVFYMSRPVIEKMISSRTKGVVVNISSIAAEGNPGQGPYSASKAAVRSLTTVWAKELAPFGIRSVCVAPGFTDTATTRGAMQENVLKDWIRRTPARRLGKVEELVAAVMFVIKNDFANGRTFCVDGGLTL